MATKPHGAARRGLAALALALPLLMGWGGPVAAAEPDVTWTTPASIAPAGARSCDQALARLSESTGTILFAVYGRGKSIDAPTAPSGVYLRRSSDRGRTWGSPVKLAGIWARCPAVAAEGRTVAVAWLDPTASTAAAATASASSSASAGQVAVRVSVDGGRTWGPTRHVPTPRRAEEPSVAVAGGRIHVAWTDQGTLTSGRDRWARVAMSSNRGATWTLARLDSVPTLGTHHQYPSGGVGLAASGATVLAAWTRLGSLQVVARTSLDGGRTWERPVVLGTLANYRNDVCLSDDMTRTCTVPAVAVGETVGTRRRLVVAWPAALGTTGVNPRIDLRVATHGSWGPVRSVSDDTGTPYRRFRALQVTLPWGGAIGLAWIACPGVGCFYDPIYGPASGVDDVLWRETYDNGATWTDTDTVAEDWQDGGYMQTGWLSLVWSPKTLFRALLVDRLAYEAGGAYIRSTLRFVRGLPVADDGMAPTIVSRTPAPGATGVPRNTPVTLRFSEPIRRFTVSSANVRLRDGVTLAYVPWGPWSFSATEITLQPSTLLVPGRSYRVFLLAGGRDLADEPLAPTSWTFRVSTDATRPTLLARTPGAGATGVPIDAVVSATFSEGVTGVGGGTFGLWKRVESATQINLTGIPAVVTYDPATRTAVLDPVDPLDPDSLYEVVISTRITDVAANPFTGARWQFSTGGVP